MNLSGQDQTLAELLEIGDELRAKLSAKNQARDLALTYSRNLVRACANTIRAIHRGEMENARELLRLAEETATVLRLAVADDPDLYYAGYTQDGLKELVAANVLLALLTGTQLPTPEMLQVEAATYLKGLAEAATELRRTILDIIREDHSEEAERLLEAMDEIYSLLVTIDYPESITRGLRRNTDVVRGVRERPRGDLTMSLRQQRLQQALRRSAIK